MNAAASLEPRLNHVRCLSPEGLHRMAYWEWGDAANPRVLVCVHGLSRQGRDFDTLARALVSEYRVVCPDVVGRGQSDWLSNPASYAIAQYVADMVTLVARLGASEVHWVGTSMGGLIGLGLASLSRTPIARMIMNDVGPALEYAALARIAVYLGMPVHWQTMDEAADQMRAVSLGFGPHTREQWMALSRRQAVPVAPQDGGGFRPHYDPAIAVPFRAVTPELAAAGEGALWRAYDAVHCPTLVLRGADSDLLSAATADEMTRRGPHARLHQFAGVGHAPTLVQDDQIAVVREFLLAPSP